MKISSGVTLVNLACSGDPDMIAKPGWIVNLVGDSNTGKSFLARTILADNYYRYKDALFYVYDNRENGVHWDDSRMFGKQFAENALEPAFEYKDKTIEEWYQIFNKCVAKSEKEKRPFLYVLDSWDAINSNSDIDYMKAIAEGKDKKSMGMAKAKLASKLLSDVVNKLEATGSILFIISQTRDNPDPMSYETRTRSGGRALRFYASLEVWLSGKGKLKLDADTDPHGILVRFKQRRSRLLGHESVVEFPITYVYGIDDTQASVDYLVEMGVIKKEGHSLVCTELDIKCPTRKFSAEVEAANKKPQLNELVVATWRAKEKSVVDRILQGRMLRYA